MAKKNANNRSKTATEKLISNSEPKVQMFSKWTGMNIDEYTPGWSADEGFVDSNQYNETDIPKNFLVQNNVLTNDNLSVETRQDTYTLYPPAGEKFHGAVLVVGNYLYAATTTGIVRAMIRSNGQINAWSNLTVVKNDLFTAAPFVEFNYINATFLATDENGILFSGRLDNNGRCAKIFSARPIPSGVVSDAAMTITPKEQLLVGGCPTRISFCYSLSNRFGNTVGSSWSAGHTYSKSPAEFSHEAYINIAIQLPSGYTTGQDTENDVYDITGVDIYCHIDDAQDGIFIGHVNVAQGATQVSFDWLGALDNLAQWPMAPLTVPMENLTTGPRGKYMNVISSRLYVWEGSRIWYGGNPGNEIKFDRGTGGGWIDCEPKNFVTIKDVFLYKTYNATIVTALGYRTNTHESVRFNLVEHMSEINDTIAVKGMFAERVTNVSGTLSRNSSLEIYDGLYCLSRYGVLFTSGQMSSNILDKQDIISEAIKPVFNNLSALSLQASKLVGYRNKLYMSLGEGVTGTGLNDIVFVYNILLKSWYTYSGFSSIKNLTYIDSVNAIEGLCIVTEDAIYRVDEMGMAPSQLPPTGFSVLLETGELSVKVPLQTTQWLDQVEFRFDYLVGELDFIVDYVDYYGRRGRVTKRVSLPTLKRNWTEWLKVGAMVESYNVTIKGAARFRFTHFLAKVFAQSNKIGTAYGWNDHSQRKQTHGMENRDIHHTVSDYNNLRDVIVV